MREVAYIKQNKEKWLEFEQAIFGKAKKNPDEMFPLAYKKHTKMILIILNIYLI